jgi:hypothetical protein
MLNKWYGRFTPLRRFVVSLTLLLALVAPATVLAQAPAAARVIAVGDVHGDYDAFTAILHQAGLIDSNLRWVAKDATLVQLGDFLDRGAKARDVMDLLMALEKQAPRQGSRVIALLGNHEMMNIMGDLRYAAPMYPSFVDKDSEKRRTAAYRAFVDWQKLRAEELRQPVPVSGPEAEAAWMAAHPPGFLEEREAMSLSGKYGHWLRERPPVLLLDGTLFVHGGISPELASWKVGDIEKRVENEILAFDKDKQTLVERKTILPFFTLEETVSAVQKEVDFLQAELDSKVAEAARKGKTDSFEGERRHIRSLNNFLAFGGWLSVHPSGPLWFRGYANWSDAEGDAQIAKLASSLGVSQFVVGHTPQKGGRIASRFGGKVFLIDTGMLSSYYNGGRASALELMAGKITAIYMDERVVLLDPARSTIPASPAAKGEVGAQETPGGGVAEEQQSSQQPPASGQAAPAPAPAQAGERVWYDADGKPLPFKTDEEVMEFLRTAKVLKMKDIPTGVAHPRKALIEKDGLRANAKFSDVHEEKDQAEFASGQRELFFRDDAIFDLAAQELGKLLGMDNLPPVVQRSVGGDKGVLQIWVENTMTEKDRQKQGIRPPDPINWNRQVSMMKFFDNLIFNQDRNAGNILIDKNWKIWLIDHTRAFRRTQALQAPEGITAVDRAVWEKLLALNDAVLKEKLKPYLRGIEIDSLIKRRLKLIDYVKGQISKRGESEVLY